MAYITTQSPTEEELVASSRGKWSVAGVPHRGWICVDIEDLGEPQVTCEMCESRSIRYVHHMQHSDYSEILKVGCVCAGHMEGNLSASRAREASMKSRSSKRKRWITRAWKVSAKGNPYIAADGYRITVYPRGGGWAATIAAVDDSLLQHSRRNFKTIAEAKLAAFDHITRVLAGNAA
jgi:hypothetical protein